MSISFHYYAFRITAIFCLYFLTPATIHSFFPPMLPERGTTIKRFISGLALSLYSHINRAELCSTAYTLRFPSTLSSGIQRNRDKAAFRTSAVGASCHLQKFWWHSTGSQLRVALLRPSLREAGFTAQRHASFSYTLRSERKALPEHTVLSLDTDMYPAQGAIIKSMIFLFSD